ncbi:Nramp family divalent metal transporter [Zhouia sp. PK063]|uniref:Nramp family divalent metal transporter n=1 Tax=Zhouia sp. PK063 TaxID=3373602 RepID=UPI0037B1E6D7
MRKIFKNFGPGTLVAAAFIGPGTVTVCTIAGVNFGYGLLWAMLLSIIATIVLQEMAARIGIITQNGLADVIKNNISNKVIRILALVLIFSAIVIGNTAYEAGNISGGSLGLSAIFGSNLFKFFPLILGVLAAIVLWIGNYKFIERSLVILVILMSLSFIITAILTKPDLSKILSGLFIPSISENNILTIVALVGTTVVPYNLFLHAALVKEKWNAESDLSYARLDTFIAVLLGGFVSICIIIAAVAIQGNTVKNVLDLARGLEPLFGKAAKYCLGLGLFAAGITSSITAPLAAAYVANSCFGWRANLKDKRFRLVWLTIILVGVVFSSLKINAITLIQFAQLANGILLPIIAMFLVWIVNKTSVLGRYKNSIFQNIITIFIVLITVFLGIKSILKVLSVI